MTKVILDSLTDIERNVYLTLVYLNDKASLNEFYLGKKLVQREDIQLAYTEFCGKEIEPNILDETIESLNHIEIDFTGSKFEGEVGQRFLGNVIEGKGEINVRLCFGDISPAESLVRADPYVRFREDGSFEDGYYQLFIPSRRAIEAVYENSKDVKFIKFIEDENERNN